jgi:hypothetical protein
MTAMLTAMSDMDPHKIRVTWIGWDVGFGQPSLLGRATAVDSVVCLMPRIEEKRY